MVSSLKKTLRLYSPFPTHTDTESEFMRSNCVCVRMQNFALHASNKLNHHLNPAGKRGLVRVEWNLMNILIVLIHSFGFNLTKMWWCSDFGLTHDWPVDCWRWNLFFQPMHLLSINLIRSNKLSSFVGHFLSPLFSLVTLNLMICIWRHIEKPLDPDPALAGFSHTHKHTLYTIYKKRMLMYVCFLIYLPSLYPRHLTCFTW